MIEYPDIKRSTFKIDTVSYFCHEKKIKNAFISPDGRVRIVESDWHHIEEAMRLIGEKDYKLQWKLDDAKKMLEKYKKGLREATSEFDKIWYKDKVSSWESELKNSPEPHFMEDFKNVNRNRGLDAGEYLIVHHEYIAISDYRVLYLHTTKDQRKTIHCYVEKDDPDEVLHKISSEEVKMEKGQEKYMRQISYAIREYEYCSCSSNAFHCPSGIPRVGFSSRKHNAERGFRIVQSEAFLKEAKKFGIQWPRYTTDKRGDVDIDESSFIIPGYKLVEIRS